MSGGTTGNLTNARNINEVHQLLDRLITEVTHRGTFATVELTFTVADGIIQENSMQGEARKMFRPVPPKK